jgi:glycosyltransferase involved in cell wall biosynthesis
LIKACRELDVNLVIGGTGPLYSKMKGNENEKMKILGYVENTAFFLNSIDLFVLPSYAEACPITLLEAMACGKPVIATNVGDNRVLVREDWGRLCYPSVESIKTAISEMKGNDLEKMGKKARKFVAERYTWDHIAQKYEGIYKEVMCG